MLSMREKFVKQHTVVKRCDPHPRIYLDLIETQVTDVSTPLALVTPLSAALHQITYQDLHFSLLYHVQLVHHNHMQ